MRCDTCDVEVEPDVVRCHDCTLVLSLHVIREAKRAGGEQVPEPARLTPREVRLVAAYAELQRRYSAQRIWLAGMAPWAARVLDARDSRLAREMAASNLAEAVLRGVDGGVA